MLDKKSVFRLIEFYIKQKNTFMQVHLVKPLRKQKLNIGYMYQWADMYFKELHHLNLGRRHLHILLLTLFLRQIQMNFWSRCHKQI